MAEYIKRETLLRSLGYEETRRADVLPGSTFDIVLKEPAADAVPVVRCWECVKFRRYTKNNLSFGICKHHHSEVSENDFCSYGVRKETQGEA